MPHFPWKPIRLLHDLDQQIDRAFDDLIHRQWGLPSPGAAWQPDIDIYETDEAYLVEADIPGVPLEQVSVEVDEHSLTISGTRETHSFERTAHSVRVERAKGRFSRRFPLDQAVDPNNVQRAHKEGTLHLVIPKQ